MPVFSFECCDEACQAQLDTYMPKHDAPFPACPECNGKMKRVITSAPSVRLAGIGWAKDGYSETQRGLDSISDKADASAHKRRSKSGKDFS